ncbi:MarC family protein [uncultured Bartonella sp.]|uniref:MarC family protein n=1 Tax=uncultured Bartonella sp. TaxID=104108 RepID=UPI0025D3F828|nr:MarC family protein [uncultured Bartonella sp.]
MFDAGLLLNAFITLLVTIDPAGLVPIFLGLTRDMTHLERKSTAMAASVISLIILMAFALVGGAILEGLGISLGAFQIAGGILLFAIAFEMIFEKRSERKQRTVKTAVTKDHIHNIAAFPLAIPMIAGPGAISATILMASKNPGVVGTLVSCFVILISVIVCYGFMLLAHPIDHLLGETGRTILTRLFGVILAALAVQFVANGIAALFRII